MKLENIEKLQKLQKLKSYGKKNDELCFYDDSRLPVAKSTAEEKTQKS